MLASFVLVYYIFIEKVDACFITQERILDDVSIEMETTSNRLGFVQVGVSIVFIY